ncbi:hypothetical protein JCM13664_16220 [Methylothermus subterraneus]
MRKTIENRLRFYRAGWLGLVCLIGLAWVGQAGAHAILVEANPKPNQKLAQPPENITLRFDAPVGKRYLAVAVVDRHRRRVDEGDAARDLLDGSIVKASLKQPLPPGEYLVRYRVQSADTHIVSGSYRFTVEGESRAQTDSKSLLDRLLDRLAGR